MALLEVRTAYPHIQRAPRFVPIGKKWKGQMQVKNMIRAYCWSAVTHTSVDFLQQPNRRPGLCEQRWVFVRMDVGPGLGSIGGLTIV